MLNLLTFLALAAAPVPQTAPVEAGPTLRVSHTDLDLSKPDGRARLDRRIAVAVDKVCPAKQSGELTRSLAAFRCRTETRARVAPQRNRAVAQADAPVQVSSAR